MFPPFELMRARLREVVIDEGAAGRVVDGLLAEVDAVSDSYDAMAALATRLQSLPFRDDWSYVEPDSLETILEECDPSRELGSMKSIDPVDAAARAEAAFYGSMCGCILGKPVEVMASLDDLKEAFEAEDEWPIVDYVPERIVPKLRFAQGQWPEVVRERIAWVAPDDDINYSIIGMLALEQRGLDFTHNDLRLLWGFNLPVLAAFGPERTHLLALGLQGTHEFAPMRWSLDPSAWAGLSNPGAELCGALIRADAYGYACLGHPSLAAELAHRDATLTHRRNGVYGPMLVAAAIAAAAVVGDAHEIFPTAVRYIPQRSRLAEAVRFAIDEVAAADDWLDGYRRINARYGEFGHCRLFQEVGTMVNTLRFATDVGHGICLQVMQGNDTDSFGATCGSILGAFFGPGHLDHDRWVAPFNDTIHTAMATFDEQSLSAVAKRMSALPGLLAR